MKEKMQSVNEWNYSNKNIPIVKALKYAGRIISLALKDICVFKLLTKNMDASKFLKQINYKPIKCAKMNVIWEETFMLNSENVNFFKECGFDITVEENKYVTTDDILMSVLILKRKDEKYSLSNLLISISESIKKFIWKIPNLERNDLEEIFSFLREGMNHQLFNFDAPVYIIPLNKKTKIKEYDSLFINSNKLIKVGLASVKTKMTQRKNLLKSYFKLKDKNNGNKVYLKMLTREINVIKEIYYNIITLNNINKIVQPKSRNRSHLEETAKKMLEERNSKIKESLLKYKDFDDKQITEQFEDDSGDEQERRKRDCFEISEINIIGNLENEDESRRSKRTNINTLKPNYIDEEEEKEEEEVEIRREGSSNEKHDQQIIEKEKEETDEIGDNENKQTSPLTEFEEDNFQEITNKKKSTKGRRKKRRSNRNIE